MNETGKTCWRLIKNIYVPRAINRKFYSITLVRKEAQLTSGVRRQITSGGLSLITPEQSFGNNPGRGGSSAAGDPLD